MRSLYEIWIRENDFIPKYKYIDVCVEILGEEIY